MATTFGGPASRADQTLAWNMQLIGHHELAGFGGVGEGMAMQKTRDGRRVLWLAHESAPKNFTALDVTDPRQLKQLVQTDLPHARVRSNSLDVVGDIMAVAYQARDVSTPPAGFDLFDISRPESPTLITHFDASGPHSRGVHCLWFVDGQYVHMASGAADFTPTHPNDDQCYRIIDVRNPSQPAEVGRWWYPGTRVGDSAALPVRMPAQFDTGFRVHNANVFPERPERAYLGYIDGSAVILDIGNLAQPTLVSNWRYSPPFNGFCHTVLPLLSRDLLIVSDECVRDAGGDWPKLVRVVDARVETNLQPVAILPMPPYESFAKRGGRYGAHNLHENLPVETSWRSDTIVVDTFFNGGVRAYDVSNPYQSQEVAYYVPAAPRMAPSGAIQLNDVYIDDRGVVFTVDRHIGGVYVLEMTV